MARVERVADTTAHTGEGPVWHPAEQRLYWVDIPAGRLYRYDPKTDENTVAYETDDVPLGGVTVEADGALLLFTRGRVERLVPGEETTDVIATVDADARFNDVIADPEGRVFAGTMPGADAPGDLYRIDPSGSASVVVEGVNVPNGMGFSGDGTTFFLTESEKRRIDAFDYAYTSGAIGNRRAFVETPPGDGVPDGMTVDAEGYLWSARWDGGRLVRYDPTGRPVREVEFPARKVSSLAFAGPGRTELYATTALADADRAAEGEGAGALFRVRNPGAAGVPEFRSRIAVD